MLEVVRVKVTVFYKERREGGREGERESERERESAFRINVLHAFNMPLSSCLSRLMQTVN